MNIEGAKIATVAPTAAAVEAGSQSLPDAGAMPEGFADALTEQIKLASEAQGLELVPKPLQNLTSGDNLNRLHSIAGLLGNQGAAQELAALFGKNLPMSYKVNEEDDLEDTLSTLTEALKHVSTGSAAVQEGQINPEQVGAGGDVSAAESIAVAPPALIEIEAVKNLPTEVAGGGPDAVQAQVITDDFSVLASEDQTGNPVVTAEAMEVIKAMLAATVFPGQEGEKFIEAAASKEPLKMPLSFANHSAEAIQLNGSGESVDAVDELQAKDGVFRQIIQDGQEMAGLKKAGLAEKMEQAGPVAVMETEEILPRVATDSVQPSKQAAESRVEVPAMARPVSHPEWNRDLGERILWMHNKAMPAAEIKLNPQHLGPISVRIDMNQDQATVTFTAQHAAVREALEASVPRLREMMNAQQINLADVSVFQNPSEQRHSQSQGYPRAANDWEQSASPRAADIMADDEEETGKNGAVVSKGLLSIYA